MIRLAGVTLARQGSRLLDEVTLHVRPGELVAVEGGRGAGKSLLLQVVLGLARPDAGEVWIAGRDIARLQSASLPFVRRNIGVLTAEPLFGPRETARDAVLLPLAVRGEPPARARQKADAALERVAIETCADRLVATLSAGERRLVALARALAGEPPILVLDDPAAGLPALDIGRALSAMLAAIEAGGSILCACPEASFATAVERAGGRRVRIEAGRVVGGARPAMVGQPRPQLHVVSEPLDITEEPVES